MAEGVKDHFVTNDLDALPTALYVHLDDHVLPALGWSRAHRPGRKPAGRGWSQWILPQWSIGHLAGTAYAFTVGRAVTAGLWARMARMTGTGRSPSSATCSITSPVLMNALSRSASG